MHVKLGKKHIDERGEIIFANDFDLTSFIRCYHITHTSIDIIRGWQGHFKERKAFMITKGSFLIQWVLLENENPRMEAPTNSIILSSAEPSVLILPAGLANGFKALEKNSSMMVFSDMNVRESKKDDYRWDSNYFINAQWK